ncbi:MAG: glycosyltransferase [Bacteriovoracaceae bacterium]|nr:glycosyltransferase [Bacteriovoracaceae bacterium]
MQPTSKTLCLFAPGPIGGAEKVVSLGSESISSRIDSYEVWIIKEERAPRAASDFSKLLKKSKKKEFASKGIFDFALYRSLKKSYEKNGDAIIHTHGFKALAYASLIAPLNKIIHTHHGVTSHTLKVKIYEAIEFFLMKRVRTVIAVSDYMNQHFLKIGLKNSTVVENPLSIDPILKDKLSSKIKFTYVGRLSPEKGIINLLTACGEVETKEDWELHIYGDGILRSDVEKIITNNNYGNIFYHGFTSETSSVYSQTDCLILPSFTEGLPLTLIEALCCGLPVIANSVGAIPSLIEDKINGILLASNEPIDIKKGIEAFLHSFTEMTTAAKAKQHYYTQRFSLDVWTDKTIKQYQRL